MNMNRILHAYCVELDAVVNIDTARKYFVCEEPAKERYNFFCDDENCGHKKVRISGVRYKELATESVKFIAAHFRKLDDHHPECQWWQHGDPDQPRPGESEEDFVQRRLRRKLHDLVTVFDPSVDGDDLTGPSGGVTSAGSDVERDRSSGGRDREKTSNYAGGHTTTNQLTRLVETYLEAKSELTKKEFSELTIRIRHEGTIKLADYFCHVKYASYDTVGRVLYGGATLVKRYNRGFRFKFYDEVAKTKVFLYVSDAQMADFRFKKIIEQALAEESKIKYFTVFVLGHLRPGQKDGNSDLVVDDLRHLALVLGPQKDKKSIIVAPTQEDAQA